MVRWIRFLASLAPLLAAAAAVFAQQVTGTYWFADKPFPEYMNLWQEGWSFTDAEGNKLIYARPDMPLGGYLFVYYANTTGKPLTPTDLTIQGIPLSQGLGKLGRTARAEDKYYSSILFSKLPKQQTDGLKDAGWPVWWKPDPPTVEPGQCGKIIVRMRRNPKPAHLDIGVVYDGGTLAAKVATTKPQPRFGTIAFSADLKIVYLYPHRPKPGSSPARVYIDGRDVTASAVIRSDKSIDISPIIIRLNSPLELMSYHDFRVVYADGSAAQAGIRAWGHEMVYGMWSSPSGGDDPESATKSFIEEYVAHNINAVMPYVVGKCRDYFHSDAGWDYCEKMGVGRMLHWPDGKHRALFLFAMDEPDASDAACRELEPMDRLGVLGQFLVDWTRQLHKSGPGSPVLLNIDNTYKPENWYMYHQIPDIPAMDPYYPEQQDFSARNPYFFGAHVRPTYVQAVCAISQSAAQPNPLHAILCSTRYTDNQGFSGRYPTPVEKRMEVYYAVGSGVKGISYWWFAKDSNCHGLDERTPEARALWKEIGLLGAEVRTAGPLITTSCPADLPMKASKFLWARSLVCGGDTVALTIVNDNIASDRLGTMVKPVENARVSVDLPSWVEPNSVFEVTCDGITDIGSQIKGRTLTLELGTVNVSRFVIITADRMLRDRLQKRYDEMFAANVRKLKESATPE